MSLTIKPTNACAFDQISLGEVMLRLDPGEGRIRTARSFTAWEGGGEYNTSRGLRKCFGLRTAVSTALDRSSRYCACWPQAHATVRCSAVGTGKRSSSVNAVAPA